MQSWAIEGGESRVVWQNSIAIFVLVAKGVVFLTEKKVIKKTSKLVAFKLFSTIFCWGKNCSPPDFDLGRDVIPHF